MNELRPTSLFRESNFIMQFKQDIPAIDVMVTLVNLPEFGINQLEIPRPGLTDKRPGNHLTFEDLSVNVNCDEKLEVYKEIQGYLLKTSNPHTANFDIDYPIFDGTLFLTTNKNNIQHKIVFYNCFFKKVSGLVLQSSTTDENQVSFTLTLGYTFFDFI
jgi:hypothetical protein